MKHFLFVLGAAGMMLASCGDGSNKKTPDSAPAIEKEVGLPKPKAPAATGVQRILFVGNSHTDFYISIPKMFAELCDFNKLKIEEAQLVEMGISIEEIYNMDKARAEKIFSMTDADGNYFDYVVLQEKTPVALQEADKYKTSVKMMLEKIKKNSPGVATYIYEVMSPVNYAERKEDFNKYHDELRKNALAVVAGNSNTGLYRVGDAIKHAYEGKQGYRYTVNGKDNLRYGQETLHMLNDGGFLAATLLYTTLFNRKPEVPEEMTFSAGTSDDNGQKRLKVEEAVSNPDVLLEIAMEDR